MQKTLLITATLVLLMSGPAHAGIIAQLDDSSQIGAPGDTLIFNVTLTNSSTNGQVWLNGISSTAASPFLSIDTSPFDTNAPLFLDPLASSGPFELFDVTIAPGTPAGPYIGSVVAITGGADSGAGTAFDDLVDIRFDVNVPAGGSAVPEPGTFGLLSPAILAAGFARRSYRRSTMRSALVLCIMMASMRAADIKTVHFMSEDHKTRLVAYLFEPTGPAPHAAIVLLHGRAGPYSALANGVYDATTLSKRHQKWGNFWVERGYYALLVDSFGPRNYPKGFPAGSYKDRPPELSEQTVRPLDAYGALRYLRAQKSVMGDRIGVQGWSNGGMTVLATMSDQAPGRMDPGFRAAVAEYPGCGMDAIKGEYQSYAPILMLLGSEDKEVNPKICEHFAERAKAAGSPLEVHVYPGAGHNYDDPGKSHQSVPANHSAAEDTFRRVEGFFAGHLKHP